MKLKKLASALRRERLPRLAQEAAWRTVRSTRKAAFNVFSLRSQHSLHFHPIGYYQSQGEALPASDRQSIIAYADAVVAGKYPMLGYGSPDLGAHPDWHYDWVSQQSWPLAPSRKMHIVRHDGSDVKAPWELSRLQGSPVVAKAWVLTGDPRYREVLRSLLTDWVVNNPPGKGLHWTVAMEAALRSISLCLTMELLWPFAEAEQAWLGMLEKSLWQHLRFIEVHNEFSWLVRSNHYLSNLVGLVTLSAYLRGSGMARKRARYAQAVQRELVVQTYTDGGDREASTGYHLLVAQMALHSLAVQRRAGCEITPAFEARLRLMFEWMAVVADDDWTLPAFGDCDNGRVELMADDIAQTALDPGQRHGLRVSSLCGLASHLLHLNLHQDRRDAAWISREPMNWAQTPTNKRSSAPIAILPETGISVLRLGDASVVFYAMPNGLDGKGSHTHCDKLSFILRLRTTNEPQEIHEVFCDGGSRCYTRSAEIRNRDRSTLAHNTLSIDAREQNSISLAPGDVFQMGNEAAVTPVTQRVGGPLAVQASHHGYASLGIEHQRTVELCETSLCLIDTITGPANGENHQLDLHFILGPAWSVSSESLTGETVSCDIQGPRRLTLTCAAASSLLLTMAPTEIAREYGVALPASSLCIRTFARLPSTLRTIVNWS